LDSLGLFAPAFCEFVVGCGHVLERQVADVELAADECVELCVVGRVGQLLELLDGRLTGPE